MLFTLYSGTPVKIQTVHTKNINYKFTDWKITNYLSCLFVLKIFDTLTYLTCHHNKSPNLLEDVTFIVSFDGKSLEAKTFPIDRDKFTHLGNNCVRLKNLFDKNSEKQNWVMSYVKITQKWMVETQGLIFKIIKQY